MAVDKSKLAKLLMLATSDNDHEALLAIRKATELLKRNQLNWEEFLGCHECATARGSGATYQRDYEWEPPWQKRPRYREWSRNQKGNWVKKWGLVYATVFRQRGGDRYVWVYDGKFSPNTFRSEFSAMDSFDSEQ